MGKKQNTEARKPLRPDRFFNFLGLYADVLLVYLALSLEYFSSITNRPTNTKSIDASCIAVLMSYMPYHVRKIPVVKV